MSALAVDSGQSTGGRDERTLGRRARVDARIRGAAGAALWLSLLLVTYWWVADSGLQDLTGWTTGLTSVGRISGLAASVLLLAQVVLMARVPVLERAFGQDRLARLHRLVGFTSFTLMLAHLAAITWGYAAGRLADTPSMLWHLTVDYPGMLLALAGTACLVIVVVTSVRAARRRLRYESWHLLHLYAYLGVGLALPHQLWTGQQFVGSPGKTVFWWTAWAVAAGAVLGWRIGVPAWLNLRHRLRVTSVVQEADDVWSVYLTGRRLDRLPAEAGQFFSWRFLTGPGWSRAHPYSLSAAPDGHSLRITVQGVGDGSLATGELRPGVRALIDRTAGSAPGPGPAASSPSSVPASAPPRCGPSPRASPTSPATRSISNGSPRSRSSPARSTSWLASADCRCSGSRGTAVAPTPGWGTSWERPTISRRCATGFPTSPIATSTSAGRQP